MVSITEYAYELANNHQVYGHKVIKSAPIDNARILSDMIIACGKKWKKKPDMVYIAHSLPFIKGNKGRELNDYFNVPVIYLSGLPCAITHMAVKAAAAQIENDRYDRILVFGADKAYSDRERNFFGTVMGDAVIGMMLEKGDGLHEVVVSSLDTVLFAPEGENSGKDAIQKYRETLPLLLRDAYKNCLSKSGLSAVDFIAPHTSSREIWDIFAELVHMDRDKILDANIVQTGHFNSNDSFYHYFTHCEDKTIGPGKTAMLINPGFGGTRGCTILRRR